MGLGTESLFGVSGSHDQDGHHAMYGKNPLKIFFSGTKANDSNSNDDLWLTMTFFTTGSDLLPYAFIWKNIHFFRKNVRKSFNGRNLQ